MSRHTAAAPVAWLAAALALGGAPAARAATPEELADFDAKTEYAYFTEDGRALTALIANGAPLAASSQPLELYQYAHAQFRALQVAFLRQRTAAAEAAGSACEATLDRALEAEPRSVEALSLAAACAGYVAAGGGLRALTAGHRSDTRLAAARALAPDNPRMLLTAAIRLWYRAGATAAEHGAARADFERAARAFDTVAATAPGAPSWGGAEAWLFAGRAAEAAGDLIGARSAYEKSLLVAPEFAAARRRLAALSARR